MSPNIQAALQLVGRVLLSALFLIAGFRKLIGFEASLAYMTRYGLPYAEYLLVLTIALEIGAGLLLAFGWNARAAAGALALFVLVITPIFHAFWTLQPPQLENQLNHLLKNAAIIGGLLYVAALGAGAYSIDALKAGRGRRRGETRGRHVHA